MISKKSLLIEYTTLIIIIFSSFIFAWLGFGAGDRHQFASMGFAGLNWNACFGRLESEANGFLYYLALGLFNDIWGWKRSAATAFSALSIAGSAFFIYLAVRRLWGARSALYSALFLVSYNSSIFFSSYIRFYAFNMLFVSLTAFLTVLWVEKIRTLSGGSQGLQSSDDKVGCYLWSGISLLLALSLVGVLSTMIVSATVSVAVFIAIVTDNPKDKKRWLYIGVLAALLLALWGILMGMNPQAYALQGKNMAPSLPLVEEIYAKYLGLEAVPGRQCLSIAFMETSIELRFIAIVMSVILLIAGFRESWKKKRFLFVVWSLLPLLLLVYSFIFKPIISIWNLSFIIPALAAIMGVGLAQFKLKLQYVFLVFWACLAQIALIHNDWPADLDYARAWHIRSQRAQIPLLLADFQVMERAESCLEPYFLQPSFTLDNSRRLLIPIKQYRSETEFWQDKNAFNARFGRPVHDGTELANLPWRLLLGVSWLSWQQFPYKEQGAALRNLLAKPTENIDNLALSLSAQARPWRPERGSCHGNKNWQFLSSPVSSSRPSPQALFILYTSPWCASEVEAFDLQQVADFLPLWRRVVVWNCGGVQLALVSFR